MFNLFKRRKKGLKANNAVNYIHVFWKSGTWVFDDLAVGLVEEPFVAGADLIITDTLGRKSQLDVAKRDGGARIVFSSTKFPDYDIHLEKDFDKSGHGVYKATHKVTGDVQKGWLCPATLHYFKDYPDNIYANVTAHNAKLFGY